VHGRLDLALGPSARPDVQRAVTRQLWDSASPIVSTIIRTNREHIGSESIRLEVVLSYLFDVRGRDV
jgi:hypothetical protein